MTINHNQLQTPIRMNNRILPILLLSTSLFSGAISSQAQNHESMRDDSVSSSGSSRPVTGIYAIEIGNKDVIATYLSPLHYHGTSYGLSGAWSKAFPWNPEHTIMHFDGAIEFDNLMNPAGTAKMVGLMADFKWGISWRTHLPEKIQLTAGASVDIDGGAYYLLRNGNNPVQAMATIALSARLSVCRPFSIGKLDFLLSDKVSVPSISAFFCPEFGETYYEIYLGNHRGLVHAGWWGNNFRIDNLLSATIDFGRTAMMIGYRFKADTQWANYLNTKIFSHSFVIGVVPGGIGLKKKSRKIPSETIYSIY